MAALTAVSGSEWMTAIHRAMAAQKRYGTQFRAAEPAYKCSICHDKEYIWDDNSKAMIPCKCHAMRVMERRLARAGISMEEYKKHCIRQFPEDRPEAAKMKALALRFIKEHEPGEGIIYTGRSGTMKTSICMAICMEMTRRGQLHKYFSYRDEMPGLKWKMFHQADEYQAAMKELTTCDNLFVDDLFKTMKPAAMKGGDYKLDVTPTDLQIVFQLVNGRYLNKKTTIFSTEYPLKKIIKEIDEATGTRIYEMCRHYAMGCTDINRRLRS